MAKDCKEYFQYQDQMYPRDGVLLFNDKLVVPELLRNKVLTMLHAAHQGKSTMLDRAAETVFWPGYTINVEKKHDRCSICNCNAPSQAQVPTVQSGPPSTPFESIAADFFNLAGVHFLITVDRLSGWLDITRAALGTAGAKGLIACLRTLFMDKGFPKILLSDGGPEFMAAETQTFLKNWQVTHRLSLAYNPQSHGRAEAGVKTAKQLLRDNCTPLGRLETDKYMMAIMMHRNTKDKWRDMSPARCL